MNILGEIRNDHLSIRRVLGELERTSNRRASTRERGFDRLYKLLKTHTEVEQEVLYRILLRDIETRRDILESLEEHHLVDLLLEEMAALSVTDEHWDAKLRVLRETFDHHVEVEETKIFAFVRRMLPDEKIMKEMGRYYHTLFHERMPKPAPSLSPAIVPLPVSEPSAIPRF